MISGIAIELGFNAEFEAKLKSLRREIVAMGVA